MGVETHTLIPLCGGLPSPYSHPPTPKSHPRQVTYSVGAMGKAWLCPCPVSSQLVCSSAFTPQALLPREDLTHLVPSGTHLGKPTQPRCEW